MKERSASKKLIYFVFFILAYFAIFVGILLGCSRESQDISELENEHQLSKQEDN